MSTPGYIHTYSATEQSRLIKQAQFLRPLLHGGLRFQPGQRVLEIGCGVGAQLKMLAEHAGVRLTGVDRSSEQLEAARRLLADEIAQGRVELIHSQGESLPFADGSFAQVLIFFVLEHVSQPLAILREARRVLAPDGRLTITEIHNTSLYIYPPKPTLMAFWQAGMDLQREMGGDPDVGARIVNLAMQAGFGVTDQRSVGPGLDARLQGPARLEVVEFWTEILQSLGATLLSQGKVRAAEAEEAYRQMSSLVDDPEAVLVYAAYQLVGIPSKINPK